MFHLLYRELDSSEDSFLRIESVLLEEKSPTARLCWAYWVTPEIETYIEPHYLRRPPPHKGVCSLVRSFSICFYGAW